jgi:hypothetical protein
MKQTLFNTINEHLDAGKVLEKCISGGPRFVLTIFLRPKVESSEEYFENLKIFLRSIAHLDYQLAVIDVDQEIELALSHRISISPTLVVFESGSRSLTRICELNYGELKDWFEKR